MTGFLYGTDEVVLLTEIGGYTSAVPGLPLVELPPQQELLAALVTDSDAFFNHGIVALSVGGAVVADFVPDDGAIYAATVVPGSVSLLPALVPIDDAIPAPTIVRGAVSLLPALLDDIETIPAPSIGIATILLPVLVADSDSIASPAVTSLRTLLPSRITDADAILAADVFAAGAPVTLRPSRIIDADAIYAPTITFYTRTLLPSRVNDTEAVYPAYDIDTVKAGPDKKLRAPFVSSPDTIYAARFPRTPQVYFDPEAIYAVIIQAEYPLLPALVADADAVRATNVGFSLPAALLVDDEAIYGGEITLFLVPELLADEEAIPAADVGWQVIADFTEDADAIFDAVALAYNDLLPEAWEDEEHVDTYPFFLQRLEGGIHAPRPPGVLTGSVSLPRRLTGSLAQRRKHLTGSISNKTRRVLTGSLRNR